MTSSTLILFQIRFSDSSGRGGIVVYGGEEPGSSPTAEPKQEPPTASAEGPAVPLGPIDGMPMPSVDVVEEEKDESLNMARRLFPDVELPDKPEKPCSAELQVEPPRMVCFSCCRATEECYGIRFDFSAAFLSLTANTLCSPIE